MRKRYSRSYTVLSFLTMFSYRELPSDGAFILSMGYEKDIFGSFAYDFELSQKLIFG